MIKNKNKSRSKYSIGDFRFRVGRGVSGKGLFATSDIPKGKCLIEYKGKVIPKALHNIATGRYLFWSGKTKMIDGNVKTNPARYINHSCRPNCEADGPDGKIYILSLRKIKAGEEITYNYGREYFNDYIKPIGCRCVKCRK
jgi:uncharacterized protein